MKTVLLLNNTSKACGVQQWGIRLGDILPKSTKFTIIYKELHTASEYRSLISEFNPEIVVYNYHVDIMPWLNRGNLYPGTKHVAIVHEGFSHLQDSIGFDYYVYVPESTVVQEEWKHRVFKVGRALLKYDGVYPVNKFHTIGSFGFGFPHKQFPLIVRKVNEEFDTAIIRFNIPKHFRADPGGAIRYKEILRCNREITKPGIDLQITREFLPERQLMEFLAGNDVNAFFYDNSKEDSSSGATDFALSVDRPIAITDSRMFKHITDRIGNSACIEYHTFSEIIQNGTAVLSPLKAEWSNEALLARFEEILSNVL